VPQRGPCQRERGKVRTASQTGTSAAGGAKRSVAARSPAQRSSGRKRGRGPARRSPRGEKSVQHHDGKGSPPISMTARADRGLPDRPSPPAHLVRELVKSASDDHGPRALAADSGDRDSRAVTSPTSRRRASASADLVVGEQLVQRTRWKAATASPCMRRRWLSAGSSVGPAYRAYRVSKRRGPSPERVIAGQGRESARAAQVRAASRRRARRRRGRRRSARRWRRSEATKSSVLPECA